MPGPKLAVLCAALAGSACATTSGSAHQAELDALRAAPWLQTRVLANPYGFFRFVNARFASEVCKRLASRLPDARRVNLHGDAHLEQYAVTDTGRGLSDFDDSASGPAIIDLVRFATSLHLAARARGWGDSAPELVDAFVTGYRAALEDPEIQGGEPSVVGRLRQGFQYDPVEYFRVVGKMGEPITATTAAAIEKAMQSYVDGQLKRDAKLEPAYFQIVHVARTHIGIGSALTRKYLVRVRGPAEDPSDDVVLEMKEVSSVRRGPCLDSGAARDPLRLLTSQARIAYEPYRHPGYLIMEGTPFWVHAWARAYVELSADKFESLTELREVAHDVGIQLGLGHPRFIAAPFDLELRREITEKLREDGPLVQEESRALADEVEEWWRAVRAEI